MTSAATPPFTVSGPAGAARAAMNFTAPVPLAALLKPMEKVWIGGSNFFHFLMRIVRAMLARVASAFNVKVQGAGDPADGPAAQSASFVAPGDAPNAQATVEAAAEAGAREVSEFVERLISKKPEIDRLQGESGSAYLAMALEELGSSMGVAKTESEDLEATIAKDLPGVAAKLGIDMASARTLFEEGDVPEGSELAKRDDVKRLLTAFSRLQDLKRDVNRMKFSFGDHCVAAKGAGISDLAAIADAKLSMFADAELKKYVENALSQVVSHKKHELELKTSVNLDEEEGGVPKQPSANEQVIAKEAPPPSAWRSRAAMKAGVEAGPPGPSDHTDQSEGSVDRNRER
jgi:hypothetical protein